MAQAEIRRPDAEASTAHRPDPVTDERRPLRAYALLITLFCGMCAAFGLILSRSRRPVPARIDLADFILLATGTHKASRLLSKAKIASPLRAPFTVPDGDGGPAEIEERATGNGMRRAFGELVVCPYCLDMWIATLFTSALLLLPRTTRWIASTLGIVAVADFMQLVYARAQKQQRS